MMKKNLLHLLFLLGWLCLLLGSQQAAATHIVGGDMTYRCLGNDQYELSISIFRDCDTGIPWFGDSIQIEQRSGLTGTVIDRFVMYLGPQNDTLTISTPDSCLTIDSTACIHTTTYRDTITLPFLSNGYTLSYTICCRNRDIVNIVRPLSTRATYWTHIPSVALQACNGSPVYNQTPPVYLCVNKPLNVDYSATDPDGDSLVYELCTPTNTGINTSGFPPTSDVAGVTWQLPFTRTNMLGGNDSLRIDPQTGVLQGTPNILGIFLVGVCVKEYRNGVLLSITKRDFQHLVGSCTNNNIADFRFSKEDCNKTLTYDFEERTRLLSGGLSWNFDGLGNSGAADPSFTFPDTGSYVVQLMAGVGSLCPDTISKVIDITLDGLEISAVNDSSRCDLDTMQLLVQHQLDIDKDSVVYEWSPRTGVVGPSDQDSLTVFVSQTINYSVVATNNKGCKDTAFAQAVVVSTNPVLNIVANVDSIFLGQLVQLTATNNVLYQYTWTPDPALSDYTIHDPIARPRQSGTYYLTVQNIGIDGCTASDSITIIVKEAVCGLPVVFIPNAFSPNGDGRNDELIVEGNNITDLTLSIYNRWGERVFETNDQSIGWDGRFKGEDLPPDVYGYYLQGVCDDGSTLSTKGNVTLLR